MTLARRSPSSVQKLRHSRVRPSGPGTPIHAGEIDAAREARQRTVDDEVLVGAARVLEERGQQHREIAAAAPARIRALRQSMSFEGELKSMSRKTRRGWRGCSCLMRLA